MLQTPGDLCKNLPQTFVNLPEASSDVSDRAVHRDISPTDLALLVAVGQSLWDLVLPLYPRDDVSARSRRWALRRAVTSRCWEVVTQMTRSGATRAADCRWAWLAAVRMLQWRGVVQLMDALSTDRQGSLNSTGRSLITTSDLRFAANTCLATDSCDIIRECRHCHHGDTWLKVMKVWARQCARSGREGLLLTSVQVNVFHAAVYGVHVTQCDRWLKFAVLLLLQGGSAGCFSALCRQLRSHDHALRLALRTALRRGRHDDVTASLEDGAVDGIETVKYVVDTAARCRAWSFVSHVITALYPTSIPWMEHFLYDVTVLRGGASREGVVAVLDGWLSACSRYPCLTLDDVTHSYLPDEDGPLFHGLAEWCQRQGYLQVALYVAMVIENWDRIETLVARMARGSPNVQVARDQGMEMTQGQMTAGDQDQRADVTQDQRADVTPDQRADVTQDQGSDVTQDQGLDVTQDQGADVTQDQGADVTQDQGADVTQDQRADVTQDQREYVTQDQGADVTQDQGAHATQDQMTLHETTMDLDQTTQDQTTMDQMALDQARQDKLTPDQMAMDETTEDQATQDKETQDQTTEEQMTKDQTIQNQKTMDQTTEDHSGQDQITQCKLVRDWTTQHRVIQDQTTMDQRKMDQTTKNQMTQRKTTGDQMTQNRATQGQRALAQTGQDQTAQDQKTQATLKGAMLTAVTLKAAQTHHWSTATACLSATSPLSLDPHCFTHHQLTSLLAASRHNKLTSWALLLAAWTNKWEDVIADVGSCDDVDVMDALVEEAVWWGRWGVVEGLLGRCSHPALVTVMKESVQAGQLPCFTWLLSRVDPRDATRGRLTLLQQAVSVSVPPHSHTMLLACIRAGLSTRERLPLAELSTPGLPHGAQLSAHESLNRAELSARGLLNGAELANRTELSTRERWRNRAGSSNFGPPEGRTRRRRGTELPPRASPCALQVAIARRDVQLVRLLHVSGACSQHALRQQGSDAELRRRLEEEDQVELLRYLEVAGSRPLSLRNLCRLRVSHLIGCWPSREQRIASLSIPQNMKDYISFLDLTLDFTVT